MYRIRLYIVPEEAPVQQEGARKAWQDSDHRVSVTHRSANNKVKVSISEPLRDRRSLTLDSRGNVVKVSFFTVVVYFLTVPYFNNY